MKSSYRIGMAIAAVASLTFAGLAHADTITTVDLAGTTDVQDTEISAVFPNNNYGGNGGGFSGLGLDGNVVSGTDDEQKELIQFNLSSIPVDAVITSATFTQTIGTTGGVNAIISMYQVLTPWIAGTGNATNGVASTTSATYNTSNGVADWGASGLEAGTDYDATVVATHAANPSGASPSTFTNSTGGSTDLMVQLVQGWVDGSIDNDGFLVSVPQNTSATSNNGSYYTTMSEGNAGKNKTDGNTDGSIDGPNLIITYTILSAVPEPASLALLGLGGLVLLRRRGASQV